jgi:hypothetical protein
MKGKLVCSCDWLQRLVRTVLVIELSCANYRKPARRKQQHMCQWYRVSHTTHVTRWRAPRCMRLLLLLLRHCCFCPLCQGSATPRCARGIRLGMHLPLVLQSCPQTQMPSTVCRTCAPSRMSSSNSLVSSCSGRPHSSSWYLQQQQQQAHK